MNIERVFVFRQKRSESSYDRPTLYAFRESEIKTIESQWGSQNCYLVVNGKTVEGSFDNFISALGTRVDIT
jgi:hypothetical protein